MDTLEYLVVIAVSIIVINVLAVLLYFIFFIVGAENLVNTSTFYIILCPLCFVVILGVVSKIYKR